MKLHISADIEGIAGVTSTDQLWPGQFEYDLARKWMTNEVLAAIRGAEQVGVTEFVVVDSHGNGENLLLDELPDNVELIRSWPRPLLMMQGVEDKGFIGTVLIGYHAGATWPEGVQAHTFSDMFNEIRINGTAVGEAALSAATAGHYNVPVLAVSGDDGFISEAKTFLPENVEFITTKKAYSNSCVKTPTSRVVCKRIETGIAAAVKRKDQIDPFDLSYPAQVEIEFFSRKRVDIAVNLPMIQRKGSNTVCYQAKNAIELISLINVFLEYGT